MIARATLATNLITQPSEGSQQQVPLCEHSEVHKAVSNVEKGIISGGRRSNSEAVLGTSHLTQLVPVSLQVEYKV
jgi:hypothetical protein